MTMHPVDFWLPDHKERQYPNGEHTPEGIDGFSENGSPREGGSQTNVDDSNPVFEAEPHDT